MSLIHILGTGVSLSHYKPDGNKTVGVNDIWKYYETDYVVCVDIPRRFDEERLKTIVESDPIHFFTCYPLPWQSLRSVYALILAPIRGHVDTLDNKNQICFSNNSTFVATVMAYHLGAKEIVLHGVDFKGHADLSVPIVQKRAIDDFVKLFFKLHKSGVKLMVGSKDSLLSAKMPVYMEGTK